MPHPTRTIEQFQEYIWAALPMRKHVAGKEAVFDAVAVAVQEWPDEVLCGARSGDTAELIATTELGKSIKRHLALAYGEDKFGSLWLVAMQILIPIIIDLMLKWWRQRKDNQGRLRIWRRRWVNDERG